MDPHDSTSRRAQDTTLRPASRDPAETRRLDVATILQGAREIVLVHNGEAYRLRITANNKLILTK